MKILASWLQNYLSRKMTAEEMAKALQKAGVEIEQIIRSKQLDKKIVVGLVKKVTQHPAADRLKLTEVELEKGVTRLVCGAPNLEEGQKVAVAQPGTQLPDGRLIEKAVIRGEESNGMICSPAELGVGEDHSGILVLDSDFEVGTKLCDLWPSEAIVDLTTPANRSDLQSVVGLAREVAAFSGSSVKLPDLDVRVSQTTLRQAQGINLSTGQASHEPKIVATELVKSYLLQHFVVDQKSGTPGYIKRHLEAVGVRSINPVVDVTNYVMLEYGQPLHAFDAAKVKLPIEVRLAKPGEKLVTLDKVERKLTINDLVIADESGPIALAGVMGGAATEVTLETTEILLESATFDGATVRQTAARHNLRSEASARFERRLPGELSVVGLLRAAKVLEEAAGGRALTGLPDATESNPVVIHLDAEKVNTLLGLKLSSTDMTQYLENLGFEVDPRLRGDDNFFVTLDRKRSVPGRGSTNHLEVTVPWWRPDVRLVEDVVEEIGRSVGYDKFPATLPVWRPEKVNFDQYWAKLWQAKTALRALGLFEVATYSFVSQKQLEAIGHDPKNHLKLKNPLSVEQAYLRSDLLPSLLSAVAKNVHQADSFGMFEVSRVYLPKPDHSKLPDEPTNLGVITYGQDGYTSVKAALDLLVREFNVTVAVKPEGVTGLHPGRSAELLLDSKRIGQIGEVHPDVARKLKLGDRIGYLELDFKAFLAAAQGQVYKEISRFPSISRDLAVVVKDDVLWSEVKAEVDKLDAAEVKYLSHFRGKDIPAGHKSLALRLTMSSMDRTLTDKEADARVDKVFKALEQAFGAKLRG